MKTISLSKEQVDFLLDLLIHREEIALYDSNTKEIDLVHSLYKILEV